MKLVVAGQTIEVHENYNVLIDKHLNVHIKKRDDSCVVKRKLDFDSSSDEQILRRKINDDDDNHVVDNVVHFRVVRNMWMVDHGDGTATWLYSPEETQEYFDNFNDEQKGVWAFSDYVVAEKDFSCSVVPDENTFRPLCTHYVTTSATNDIDFITPLPYGYAEYVNRKNTYFETVLNDIYRNCLNRGQTQETYTALVANVKQNTPLNNNKNNDKKTNCSVCNIPNHPAIAT